MRPSAGSSSPGRVAKFQQLQKDINKLQKSQKEKKNTVSVLADKLMTLLRSYPLEQEAKNSPPMK